MKNESEGKNKLKQHILFLDSQINKICKRQDELMLRNILLERRKEELQSRRNFLEKLSKQITERVGTPKQIIDVGPHGQCNPIILFLN